MPAKNLLSSRRSANPGQALLAMAVVAVTGISIAFAGFAATSAYSLFSNSDKPAETATWDKNAVELGLRFSTKTEGAITGARFYKGRQNTGTHLGHLWDNQGRMLAEVTFKNETSSGWQTANFAKPVSVKAGQEYIVSYYAPKGNYGITTDYFKTKGRTVKDLAAPASTKNKRNGVSRYGKGFPTGTSLKTGKPPLPTRSSSRPKTVSATASTLIPASTRPSPTASTLLASSSTTTPW
jgi:hypothetical protein